MARVLTLDLSWLSPLLTLVGVTLFLSRKQTRAGQLGRVLIGLGLITLALQLIVDAAEPITEARGMRVLFASLAGDTLLAVVVGALFALLSYSSLAAVLLIATLAGAGLIGLPVALGVVIGANIGSGVLAWLNASVQSVPGRGWRSATCCTSWSGCPWWCPSSTRWWPGWARSATARRPW